MSRLVLTDDTGGWFGPMALEDMPNFFETYLCDPNAPYCGFQSWDDYFTRQLRPGARPVECLEDNGVINSACESTVYCIANNVKERDSFWLKGQPYSLRDMFHDDPFTNLFPNQWPRYQDEDDTWSLFFAIASSHKWLTG
ncbi:unnamed protein product [Rhizoctonia solani]|uniref:Uncharacterized protein n=1 Tax=Rhizoctonia solani TaxID=456999 RepID=A0A8H3CIJ5_9AGAM|nr:unnamed protein product [Rhizoctonia solani]